MRRQGEGSSKGPDPSQQLAWLPPGPMFSLTENTTFNSSSEAERKTQRFYLSCLQVERIEELGAQPLRDLIDKVGFWGRLWVGEQDRPWERMWPQRALGLLCQRRHHGLHSDWWLEHYGALGPGQLHGGAEGSSGDV